MQEYQKTYNTTEDSNVFQDILNKYLPYWPLFAVLLVASIALAWVYLRYTIPVYESTATILIKDEKKGLDQSEIVEAMNLFGSKKIVENEIEVIHSRSLAREVVKRLGLYAPITEEGRLVDRAGYAISPVKIELQAPDSLTEVGKVYFTYNDKNKSVTFRETSYPLSTWVETPYGRMRFLPNQSYAGHTQKKPLYFSLINVKAAARGLLGSLKISPSSKLSTVINLKYRDQVPKRSDDVLNALINAYNEAAIEDKNSLASNTLLFIEDRLKFVVNDLDSVERSLQSYRTRNNIIDISAQGRLFLESVGLNDQKVSEMNMQLAVLDQVENYVISKNTKGGIVPATLGVNDPLLSQLLQKLYEAELQYEQLKETTGENSPILVGLADQINRMRPNILENVRNQRRNLEAGKNDIYSTNTKYNSLLSSLPQKERELLDISRQQAIKNNIYTFLLQKREETALSYASTVADSRLVDSAESTPGPVSPNRKFTYLIGIIAAILIGVALITIKESINRNILFRSEIEKYTSTPILGEVIHDNGKNPLVITEGNRSFIAEQFRQLRTSLGYLGINSRKKKILVTSTISGEGKSFITANLGVSLSLMGKKVVLLELDLRKPKLSGIFNMSQQSGITNFFIGEKEVEDIIKKCEGYNNLFIIPAGPIPPNPSELIMNGRLQELLHYLESVFDYIIIDTAPVNPVTDAYILSPLCDATLYVIRHGITPRNYIQKLDEHNKIKGLNNMAIIFNGVRNRGFSKYGYGYGYGYGYTSEEKTTKKSREKKSTLT